MLESIKADLSVNAGGIPESGVREYALFPAKNGAEPGRSFGSEIAAAVSNSSERARAVEDGISETPQASQPPTFAPEDETAEKTARNVAFPDEAAATKVLPPPIASSSVIANPLPMETIPSLEFTKDSLAVGTAAPGSPKEPSVLSTPSSNESAEEAIPKAARLRNTADSVQLEKNTVDRRDSIEQRSSESKTKKVAGSSLDKAETGTSQASERTARAGFKQQSALLREVGSAGSAGDQDREANAKLSAAENGNDGSSQRADRQSFIRMARQGTDLPMDSPIVLRGKSQGMLGGRRQEQAKTSPSIPNDSARNADIDAKPFRSETGPSNSFSSRGSGSFAEAFRQGEPAFANSGGISKKVGGRVRDLDAEKVNGATLSDGNRLARAPVAARSSASSTPTPIIEQVAQRLALLDRPQTIRVALDPAHLGRIVIRFSRRGSQMRVKITAQNIEASSALMRDLPRLQDALARHGEDLRVDVSVDSSRDGVGGRQCFDGPGSRWEGGSEGGKKQDSAARGSDDSIFRKPGSVSSIEANRILDVTT